MKFIKKRKNLMKSKFINFFQKVILMLYRINDIIKLWDLIIKLPELLSIQEAFIIYIIFIYIYITIYKNNQSKMDGEEIMHKHKEIEKNNSEETKYKAILDNNLKSIINKFIEEGYPDIAKETFIYERDKMREQELEMQKIKNEHT